MMMKNLIRMFPPAADRAEQKKGVCLLDGEGIFPEKRKQQIHRAMLGKIAGQTQVNKVAAPKMYVTGG